jgi:uncharacterized membrane protein YagU involved in acid resistance
MTFTVVLTGIAATAIMSLVMKMAPKMGLPEMDIPKLLASMMGNNMMIGWMMHFVAGIVFTFIYAQYGLVATLTGALLYGAIHWLVVGLVMGLMPGMEVGYWMTKSGGSMAFVGGLIGHFVFALSIYYLLPLF